MYLIVLLVSALLNAAYFLPIIYTAFFQWEGEETEHPRMQWGRETDLEMLVPVVVLAALVVVVGIWVKVPGFPYSFADVVVKLLFPH